MCSKFTFFVKVFFFLPSPAEALHLAHLMSAHDYQCGYICGYINLLIFCPFQRRPCIWRTWCQHMVTSSRLTITFSQYATTTPTTASRYAWLYSKWLCLWLYDCMYVCGYTFYHFAGTQGYTLRCYVRGYINVENVWLYLLPFLNARVIYQLVRCLVVQWGNLWLYHYWYIFWINSYLNYGFIIFISL